METPEDRTPSADSSTPDPTALSSRPPRIALLFAAVLLVSAIILFALPVQFSGSLASLVPVALFGTLVAIQRHSVEPKTLRALLWGIGGHAVALAVSAISTIVDRYRDEGLDAFTDTSLYGLTWLPNFSFLSMGFLIGVLAGMRWPDKSLLPGLRFKTLGKLRVFINVLVVALIAFLWDYLFGLAVSYSSPTSRFWIFFTIYYIFVLVCYPGLLVLVAMSPAATSQARRVLLWGTSGIFIWQLTAVVPFYVALWATGAFIPEDSEFWETDAELVWIKLNHSISMLQFMGFWLGVWAGLRWPDRLAFPRGLSWIPPGSGAMRNLTALTFYSICAGLVFWVAALLTILITEPDAFL